ncbi:hypothetical protein [Raineyella fluvialis]|uniref:Uncharacterized protein n=1 Tax=Raineyella fluvialis TaxID=2662261 RepID=A0A5Q2F9T3_9ACTN|nr:hypothetical protein [Raineyella fluvialis]QGF23448.1 hypothetical protein Rai3103_06950 [Raineyella fluvialis]
MVEVNWKGIARTAKALGGEGTNYLLLKTKQQIDEDTLDAALPIVEEGPDNGGWFLGPQGWMVLVEGLDEQVNPWIEQLAARLTAAGIEGTLTGASVAVPPMWTRGDWDSRGLYASIAYAAEARSSSVEAGDPGADRAAQRSVDLGLSWLTAHGGKVMVSTGMMVRTAFWVPAEAARGIMIQDVEQLGSALSMNFNKAGLEYSHLYVQPWGLELGRTTADYRWRDIVGDFRATLVSAASLGQVSYASVAHRDLGALWCTDTPGSEQYAGSAYRDHPELWSEFVLEPCGVQILTNRHLEAANDLSAWQTTRLDDTHVLVQARDLEPWYATRRWSYELLDPQLMAQARDDFGAMILTPERAREVGLTA